MAEACKRPRHLGSVIVISAPSGAGKSTLVRRLKTSLPGLVFSVSCTTRPRRPGEKEGRDYYFVSRHRFKRMIAAGEFIEWANVFGHVYGTPWKGVREAQQAGKDILLDIDVQGHRQVRGRLPEAVSVFVLPPSFRVLQRRLRGRASEPPEVIKRRLVAARKEIAHWTEYDYLVVNDRVSRATEALRAVVLAARLRRRNQTARVRQICKTFGG